MPLEVAEQIFTEHIIRSLLSEAFPEHSPRATVLIGHPGADVTTFARSLADAAVDARPVVISVEDFRGFYPDYLALLYEPGWEEANRNQVDFEAYRWQNMAVEYLRGIGASMIIHGVSSRQTAADIVDRLATAPPETAPYEVEFAFPATSDAEIDLLRLESHQRAYEQLGHSSYAVTNLPPPCRPTSSTSPASPKPNRASESSRSTPDSTTI
ncbi:zeta toxin family protein [Nocardia sp. CA-107356]|uniref:zeta toxin family protein n=1 Tax=Nocardia sp. CA-107356 TaxID=3239972 RepID=UPI003D8EEE7A